MTHFWTMKGGDKRGKSKTTDEGTFINGVKLEEEDVDYAKLLLLNCSR